MTFAVTQTNETHANATQTNRSYSQSDVQTNNAPQDAFPGLLEHYFEPKEEKGETWNYYPLTVIDHFNFTPKEGEQMTRTQPAPSLANLIRQTVSKMVPQS